MTTHIDNVIEKQLAHIMSDEQAVLLAYAEQGGEVLMIDETGQSIYDAAASADETGAWIFLSNAINSDSMYGDWQQNPSVSHDMPDDVALGVPEKSEQMSLTTKWLLGSLATMGAFALGAAGGGGGGHHDETDIVPPTNYSVPQPKALVRQFSAAENPINPNERAPVVQAEEPQAAPSAPESTAQGEPLLALAQGSKTSALLAADSDSLSTLPEMNETVRYAEQSLNPLADVLGDLDNKNAGNVI